IKMPELKILNNKEIKEIYKLIEKQWGAKLKLDYGFLKNNKNRIFVVNKDISKIDFSKLRLNSVGMYFCEIDSKGIRLSIEGSQIVGQKAAKNVVELDEEETKRWFKGEDLEKECKDCSGFVILKHKNDFLGNGKYANSKILNYVGKTRRINL
ncbi:hypothetical protein HYX04_00890, partial [Candidatus Woesearchaeota archaeon]|nr:hypothetical protein [Candidatus Woesearchaeota archaeon]